MWLLLVQFAKKKQSAAQAATGANRPTAELARPRIIPHPAAGTIEFERGQIVAKMGERGWFSEWMISNGLLLLAPFRRRTRCDTRSIGPPSTPQHRTWRNYSVLPI
jgi:hypothetical protein